MSTNLLMLVKGDQEIPETELRQLQSSFMNDLHLSKDDFYVEGPLRKVTNDDYEAIPADDNESEWLNVNLWRSYYGVGYERGDIRLYVNVSEWLEHNLPNCEIYYGNDSAPESLVLFDKEYRTKLLEHYENSV